MWDDFLKTLCIYSCDFCTTDVEFVDAVIQSIVQFAVMFSLNRLLDATG